MKSRLLLNIFFVHGLAQAIFFKITYLWISEVPSPMVSRFGLYKKGDYLWKIMTKHLFQRNGWYSV